MIDDMDILLDEDGDIAVEDGDITVGYSTGQEAKFIIEDNNGDWKRQPLICVGINDYVKKTVTPSMARRLEKSIQINFSMDGKQLNEMSLMVDDSGKLLSVNIDCE